MTKPQEYPSQVFWDQRDEGFVAIATDLPGCSAFGKTKAKALKELDFAIEAWIASALDAGEPVPEPSKLPAPSGFSGKVLLRLPRSLHEKLAKRAELENVSLNQWMVTLLASNSIEKATDSISTARKPNDFAGSMLLAMLPANKPVVFKDHHRSTSTVAVLTFHQGRVSKLGIPSAGPILISDQFSAWSNFDGTNKVKDV